MLERLDIGYYIDDLGYINIDGLVEPWSILVFREYWGANAYIQDKKFYIE